MRKISIEEVIYQYPKRNLNDSDGVAQVVVGQHSRGLRWWAAGAIFGLAGASILPLVAELIAHHSGGLFASSSFFQKLPTRSTISILPLLILGGFCLFQAVKRSTPEPDGCSPRQLANTTKKRSGRHPVVIALLFVLCLNVRGAAQVSPARTNNNNIPVAPAATPSPGDRESLLIDRIEKLERRLAELEAQIQNNSAPSTTTPAPYPAATRTETTSPSQSVESDRGVLDPLPDTTFNLTIDGYYNYNFNRPVGGINLLRAYDVSSNSFSLNQAALVIENAPNLEKGKRYGLRLDLQYGQATETVQGNAANEPRPQVYRPVWQAYGTYIFDVGNGLMVDFGKFASALGYETNYTKDNFNYSRAYFFNFLPFYHVGLRSSYAFNDKVTLTHWLVNGVQQSEDFNGFKSQAVLLTWKPTPRITSQFNYYNGQEQRDRNPALNPTIAPVASQPGLSIDVIRPVPSGRFHVLDTYHTFNVTDKLTLAIEGDCVVGRVFRDSPPATVWGGVGYARYQWTPKFAIAGRFEYLAEKVSTAGGLFSGVNQALKEHTITAEYKFADGFLGRVEYRRDWSNQPFFFTEQPGIFKKEQNTATIGLVWWMGRKKGTW